MRAQCSEVTTTAFDYWQKGSVNGARGNGNRNGNRNGLVHHDDDKCPLDGWRNTLVASEVPGFLIA